jgi:hypothetical protein
MSSHNRSSKIARVPLSALSSGRRAYWCLEPARSPRAMCALHLFIAHLAMVCDCLNVNLRPEALAWDNRSSVSWTNVLAAEPYCAAFKEVTVAGSMCRRPCSQRYWNIRTSEVEHPMATAERPISCPSSGLKLREGWANRRLADMICCVRASNVVPDATR